MGVPRNGFVGCFETTMLMSTVSFLLKSFSYVSTEKCLKRDSHSPRSTDSHRSSCSDCRTHCKQNEVCLCLSVARSISLSVSLPLSVSVSVCLCLSVSLSLCMSVSLYFYHPHIICLYGSLCLSVCFPVCLQVMSLALYFSHSHILWLHIRLFVFSLPRRALLSQISIFLSMRLWLSFCLPVVFLLSLCHANQPLPADSSKRGRAIILFWMTASCQTSLNSSATSTNYVAFHSMSVLWTCSQ